MCAGATSNGMSADLASTAVSDLLRRRAGRDRSRTPDTAGLHRLSLTQSSLVASGARSGRTMPPLRWRRCARPVAADAVTPPDAAKPMTRWWWFGGAVTPEEITRQLTFMRDGRPARRRDSAGLSGGVDDPAKGVRNLHYFSRRVPRRAAARRRARRGDWACSSISPSAAAGRTAARSSPPTSRRAGCGRCRRTSPAREISRGTSRRCWSGEDRWSPLWSRPCVDDGTPALDKALEAVPPAEAAERAGAGSSSVGMPAGPLAGDGVHRLADRHAGEAADARHGGAGHRSPSARAPSRCSCARPATGVFDAIGSSDDAAVPLGLLRQPRGLRRRLDRAAPRRVPAAARLRSRRRICRRSSPTPVRSRRTCATTITSRSRI